MTCTRCPDLGWTPEDRVWVHEHHFSLPRKGIMVENTVLCNLRCPGCDRPVVLGTRGRNNLSLDEMRKISLIIRGQKIESLCFFNLGELFCKPDIAEELKIVRGDNPSLRITICTNGLFLDTDEKGEYLERQRGFAARLTRTAEGGVSEDYGETGWARSVVYVMPWPLATRKGEKDERGE